MVSKNRIIKTFICYWWSNPLNCAIHCYFFKLWDIDLTIEFSQNSTNAILFAQTDTNFSTPSWCEVLLGHVLHPHVSFYSIAISQHSRIELLLDSVVMLYKTQIFWIFSGERNTDRCNCSFLLRTIRIDVIKKIR